MPVNDDSEFDWGHWECDLESPPEGSFGFVYKVTELSTGYYYYGIKQLVRQVTLKPLKGKTRKRKVLKPSDWRTYCTSSGKLSEDISSNKEKYKFEIISFHPSKSQLKIEETRLIIENIYRKECYNEVVGIRLRVSRKDKI